MSHDDEIIARLGAIGQPGAEADLGVDPAGVLELARRRRRTRAVLGGAGVAAVVLAVAVSMNLLGGRTQSQSPAATSLPTTTSTATPPATSSTTTEAALLCPDRGVGTGPGLSGAIDLSAALVPGMVPTDAVVCRYADVGTATAAALDADRVALAGSLVGIPLDLAHLVAGPADACAADAGALSYSLGLQYADGVVWVTPGSGGGGCPGATNGVFETQDGVLPALAAAYQARSWVGFAQGEAPRWACEGSTRDETGPATFVPADPTAVRVCLRTGMSGTSTDLDVGAASGIIAALRALPATRGPAPCVPTDKPAGPPVLEVLLTFADRDPRTLQINLGCRPAVVGGTIVAPDADAVVAAITAATGYTLPS